MLTKIPLCCWPDFSKSFADQKCVFFCYTDGYIEFSGQCVTSCPDGFQSVGNACEECIGSCDKGDGF